MSSLLAEPRWYSLGPHAWFDLVRLARSGRSTLVRIAYILVLFAALAVVFQRSIHQAERFVFRSGRVDFEPALIDTINANARIAERFCITVLVTQNIAILILMPIYCAASIFEERDKRTLPILFTTHLTSREILLGKLASRMGHVGGVLLAGLPVLAIAQLWGGIDMEMIAANFWNAGLWLFLVGALSLMMATQSRTLLIALVRTYLFLGIPLCCCCLPLEIYGGGYLFLLTPARGHPNGYGIMWSIAGLVTILHSIIGVYFLVRARRNLDALRNDEPLAPEFFDDDKALIRHWVPEVGDDPIFWKEMHMLPATWPHFIPIFVLPLVLTMTFVIFPPHLQPDSAAALHARNLILFYLLVSGGGFTFHVAFRLAGCVVRERERQTLEALLVLPIERGSILGSKLVGTMCRYWSWGVPLALAWVLLEAFSNVPLLGFAILLALAIHFLFFAMLALWLSVTCKSSMAAHVILGLVMLTTLIGTAVFVAIAGLGADGFVVASNPVACWIEMAAYWSNGATDFRAEIAINLGGYFLTGAFLYVLAHRRFARRPL